MSPEQAAGRAIDFRADQFALGAIVYEMTTGRRAFKRETAAQTMAAIVEAEPESIAELAPEAPVGLVTVVERCLAKDPANRYASTHDLARDLREICAARPGSHPRGRCFARKRRRGAAGRGLPARLAIVAIAAAARSSCADGGRGPRSRRRARCSIALTSRRTWIRPSPCSRLLSRPARDHTARTWLAEAYLRKFEYSLSDQTLAARAGEEAGVALTINSPMRRRTSCWP